MPSKFVKYLEGRTSGSVSLIGPSGNLWHVNLTEQSGHLFLNDGWPSFVNDHFIECGDTLVFGYDGNLNFTVQVFDQTSCEKEEAFYAKCSKELSDLNQNLRKKRERDGESACSSVSSEKRMKGSWIPVHLNTQTGNKDDKLKASTVEGQELEEIVIIEYDKMTQNMVEASERSIILALPAIANGQMIPTVVTSHRKKNASKLKEAFSNKKKTGTQKKTSISKFIEAKTALHFTSTFPFFVRVMSYANVYDKSYLRIPVQFSMAHLPNCRMKVTLRNLSGDCWVLNVVPTARKQSTLLTFCGGWLAFVRGNRIEKGDVCIFELVDEFEMCVHILRLGLEGLDNENLYHGIDVCGAGSRQLSLVVAEYVPQDNEVYPQKISEQTNDLSMYVEEDIEKYSEIVPGPQLAASSSGHESDDAIVLTSSENFSPTPISKIHNRSTEQLIRCNSEEIVSYQPSIEFETDSHARCNAQLPMTVEDAAASLSLSSAFPNFLKVMMSSNVGGLFVLGIPRKFSAAYLPSHKAQIILRNMNGECWNVNSGRYRLQTKFCGGWKSFVRDNGVELGDTCFFELVHERTLQVHIFRGNRRVQDDVADNDSTALVNDLDDVLGCPVVIGKGDN